MSCILCLLQINTPSTRNNPIYSVQKKSSKTENNFPLPYSLVVHKISDNQEIKIIK